MGLNLLFCPAVEVECVSKYFAVMMNRVEPF